MTFIVSNRDRSRLTLARILWDTSDTSKLCPSKRLTKSMCILAKTSSYSHRWKRQKGDPMTPDKHDLCSTRSWQGRIRVWRKLLHAWDPPTAEGCLPFTTEDALLCDM